MTNAINYKKNTLTHVSIKRLVDTYQDRTPLSLVKMAYRVLGKLDTAEELRAAGLPISDDVAGDEEMISLFDLKRLGKFYKPFRYTCDFNFHDDDAYWIFRPTAQFCYFPVMLKLEAEKVPAFWNFLDTLEDPKLNTIKQIDNFDEAVLYYENEYQVDVFIEVPAIVSNTAYFFISGDFLEGKLEFDHCYNSVPKHFAIERMFEEVQKLSEFTGMECKMMLVEGDAHWSEITKEEAMAKLDVIKEVIAKKEKAKKKRAQRKYAKEQMLLDDKKHHEMFPNDKVGNEFTIEDRMDMILGEEVCDVITSDYIPF